MATWNLPYEAGSIGNFAWSGIFPWKDRPLPARKDLEEHMMEHDEGDDDDNDDNDSEALRITWRIMMTIENLLKLFTTTSR